MSEIVFIPHSSRLMVRLFYYEPHHQAFKMLFVLLLAFSGSGRRSIARYLGLGEGVHQTRGASTFGF